MATLTLPRKPARKLPAQRAEAPTPAPVARAEHHDEAPDRGDRGREAPERRVSRATEAPDAGYRRSNHDEGYTQGRSFS